MYYKIGALKNFAKIHRKTSEPLFSIFESLFIKKSLAQVISCELCEIFKNIFTEHLRTTASETTKPNTKFSSFYLQVSLIKIDTIDPF